MWEDTTYNFTGDLIDLDNCSADYQLGYLQIQDCCFWEYDNTTITDSLNNSYEYIPDQSDFLMYNGTMSWNNNLSEFGEGSHTCSSSTEAGHYPGTYSFRGDSGDPDGWTVSEQANTDVKITSLVDGHRDVMELETAGNDCDAYNSFSNQASGTVEFYWRTTDTSGNNDILLRDGATTIVYMCIAGTNDLYYNDGGWQLIIDDIATNTWFHFKIIFDCGTDTFDLYIDESLEVDDGGFKANADHIDNLYFRCPSGAGSTYVDAVGYSWDSDYSVGDNLDMIDCELNMTIAIYIDDFPYICSCLYWAFNTSTDELVNFSIYNVNTGDWDLINSSYLNFTVFYENYSCEYFNASALDPYKNATGWLLYKIEIIDPNDAFTFCIDYFVFRMRSYIDVSVSKSFNVKGNYRYRFILNSYGTEFITSWINFEVVDTLPPSDNIELISEAYFTTKWSFTNGTGTLIFYLDPDGLKTIYLYPDTYNYTITDIYDKLSQNGTITSNGSLQTIIYLYSPNIEIISESDRITHWFFVNESYNEIILYNESFDNLSMGYWDLYDVPNRVGLFAIPLTDDAYTNVGNPTNNYGGSTLWHPRYPNIQYAWLGSESLVRFENTTGQNSTFYGLANWLNMEDSGKNLIIHTCNPFNEDLITWNMHPNLIQTSNQFQMPHGIENQYYSFDLGFANKYYRIGQTDLGGMNIFRWYSIESAGYLPQVSSGYTPNITHSLYKNYHGSGFLYCQTNITETLTLRSPNNLNLNLQSGDFIRVIVNTTSENQINFNLKRNGDVIKSYIVHPQGLANTNTRILSFCLDEDLTSIDQLEFTGIFEPNTVLNIEDVLIHRIISEHTEVLDPDGYKRFRLEYPRNFTVYIFDNEQLKQTKLILTTSDLQTFTYTRIDDGDVYLTYYDSNYDWLNFLKFKTYANYTINNETNYNKRLGSNHFLVDENSLIQLMIYDSFDILVKTYESLSQNFIDIILDVFSLKIKSECEEIVSYVIKNINSDVIKSGNIFPEEIIEFSVANGNYSFNYTNYEDNNVYRISFELTSHYTLILNSTYHTIYFGLFTIDGLGLDRDLVRFYINESRCDFGFNTIRGDYANITVLDYFNASLSSQIINLEGLLEYNIFCEVYTLILYNNYTWHGLKINISRSDSPYYYAQTIPTYTGISLRFIPNIVYNISYSYMNNTHIGTISVNLTTNGHIESFGIYEKYPEDPFFPRNSYISLCNALGHGFHSLYFKLYKNGTRIDPGLNVIESNFTLIQVYDYFNNLLHSQLYNYAPEISITIDVIEQIVFMSNMTQPLIIRLQMHGETVWYNDTLGSNRQPKTLYLTQANYTIKAEYLNGTLFNEFNVSIDGSKIIDIGWYRSEIPAMPDIFRDVNTNYFWVAVSICACVFGFVCFWIYKNKQKDKELKLQREKNSMLKYKGGGYM